VDTVNLITRNAFAWANDFDVNNFAASPVIFGYLPSQLVANPTLRPPVGTSTLHVVIQIPHPGAPLPDIVAPNVGGLPPGYTIISESLRATATGPTPTGGQATLVVSQTGVGERTPDLIGDFGFTAEVVDIQTHGNGSGPGAAGGAGPAASVAPAPSPPAPASHLRATDATLATSLDDPLAWDIGMKREQRGISWDIVDHFA
jgi:hypothetical protein